MMASTLSRYTTLKDAELEIIDTMTSASYRAVLAEAGSRFASGSPERRQPAAANQLVNLRNTKRFVIILSCFPHVAPIMAGCLFCNTSQRGTAMSAYNVASGNNRRCAMSGRRARCELALHECKSIVLDNKHPGFLSGLTMSGISVVGK
jgi:hypothetical protein